MTNIPSSLSPRYLRSSGDALIGLIRAPGHDDRMAPVLKFTNDTGREFVIELTAAEVRALRADADVLLGADAETVARWWQTLADGSDGRPSAPLTRSPRPGPANGSASRSASGIAARA